MDRKIVLLAYGILIIAFIVLHIFLRKVTSIKKEMVLLSIIYLVFLGFSFWVMTNSYDKKGNREDFLHHTFYSEDGTRYKEKDFDTIIRISDGKKYDINKAYINSRGYIVFDVKNLKCIDESREVYRDEKGEKYISASLADWDFLGNIVY